MLVEVKFTQWMSEDDLRIISNQLGIPTAEIRPEHISNLAKITFETDMRRRRNDQPSRRP